MSTARSVVCVGGLALADEAADVEIAAEADGLALVDGTIGTDNVIEPFDGAIDGAEALSDGETLATNEVAVLGVAIEGVRAAVVCTGAEICSVSDDTHTRTARRIGRCRTRRLSTSASSRAVWAHTDYLAFAAGRLGR